MIRMLSIFALCLIGCVHIGGAVDNRKVSKNTVNNHAISKHTVNNNQSQPDRIESDHTDRKPAPTPASYTVYSPMSVKIAENIVNEADERGIDDVAKIPQNIIRVYPGHKGEVTALEVTSSGNVVFSGGFDGNVLRHELVQSEQSAEGISKFNSLDLNSSVIASGPKQVLALSLSPDERLLAVAYNSLINIIDVQSLSVVRTLDQIQGRFTVLTWDTRGQILIMGLAGGEVFAWNLSVDSGLIASFAKPIETYPGGVSSIVAIRFHPSGRAFFVAEKNGVISLWRLLRTEREMGLRDDMALADEEQVGRRKTRFAELGTSVEDVVIKSDGSYIYAIATNGTIYEWKIRGLKLTGSFSFDDGSDNRNSVEDIALVGKTIAGQTSSQLLATTGRIHTVSLWCRSGVDDKNLGHSSVSKDPTSSIPNPFGLYLVARTDILESPISLLKSATNAEILWAAQKTGNLVNFDFRDLLRSERGGLANGFCAGSNN